MVVQSSTAGNGGAAREREFATSGRLAELFAGELTSAAEALKDLPPAVVIFGSARAEGKELEVTRTLAQQLGKRGYALISGGGPGVMMAANQGAQDVGAPSVGLNLDLEHEDMGAGNGAQDISVTFKLFGPRNETFMRFGEVAFVVMPGGWGTFYEAFMVLTSIQCKKAAKRPVFFVEDDPEDPFWPDLFKWVKEVVLEKRRYISASDFEAFEIIDAASLPQALAAKCQ
jgi:hypothetical protein